MLLTKKGKTPDQVIQDTREWAQGELYSRYGFVLDSKVEVEWGIPAPALKKVTLGGDTDVISMAPPAEALIKERIIRFHPYLWDVGAPIYVFKYLSYHELLHFFIPPEGGEAHHAFFLNRELLAPERKAAHRWLRKFGFPTMGDQ